ncbi:GntR family transcriptional regulator [Thalassoroseus pseudoceratinae]|uniref:GntR family transcriptional regulator n=1 Tax=Thalassoroseus pseudoceratinae TaxID=2713176 RepID=UPI001F11411A|nr:GntR family transcriptional regulator [Thalassoroseus pseudoceratinae]
MMFLRIDPQNGLPIFEQIARQLKFAIASGVLPEPGRVPSIRELAKRTAVNPNTVARAYRELQAEGVLGAMRGEGLFVTEQAQAYCQADRRRLIGERVRQSLREAVESGLSTDELRQLIDEEFHAAQADARDSATSSEGETA